MKTLQLISQTLKKWQNSDSTSQRNFNSPSPTYSLAKKQLKEEKKPSLFQFICTIHSPIMALLAVSTLTGMVSNRFYNQPELDMGTISPVKIVAPSNGEFFDEKSTEELRKKIRNGVIPVLKQDENISNSIELKLLQQFTQIEEIRKIKGNFPYLSTANLSIETQKYLLEVDSEIWQKILIEVGNKNTEQISNNLQLNPEAVKAINEINKYNNNVSNSKFNQLKNRIEIARENYQKAINELNNNQISSLNIEQKITVLNLDDQTWDEVKKKSFLVMKRMLTQGISAGLPDSIIRQSVKINLENSFSPELENLIVTFIADNLQANLVIDEQQTKLQAEQNASKVKPVIVYVKKDQVIVDIGEEITQADFVALDKFGLSRRSFNWVGIAGSGVLVTISIYSFMAIAKKVKGRLRRRDQILFWLLSLSVPVINIFDVGYTSLPAVGFLVSSFYGPTIALTNVTMLTVLTAFQNNMIGWEYLLSSYAGSILAAFIAGRLHSREELAFLGGGVGVVQGSVYFVINLIVSATAGTIWYAILPSALWQGAVGLTYSVLALGISPYLERFFDLITPIRLAELSNPNRPLLKRLANEAPGTFQHTMFVASLAETAARKLHCNVELVRAGTLYHDIGKMHDPLSFIENQMGRANKHDKINNPWKSADIIKKHVSEGIIMAKKCGLPQAIQDFIPQHQGTLLISYFYFQAKTEAEKEGKQFDLDESKFRYDGPIPQSRETAIVMLADGCEAALRSLKDATPDQAMAMVNKIFKARWRDNQLDDSGLKYEELPIIAEIFVQVWQQFNHQRIVYPKGALEMKPKSQPEITIKSQPSV